MHASRDGASPGPAEAPQSTAPRRGHGRSARPGRHRDGEGRRAAGQPRSTRPGSPPRRAPRASASHRPLPVDRGGTRERGEGSDRLPRRDPHAVPNLADDGIPLPHPDAIAAWWGERTAWTRAPGRRLLGRPATPAVARDVYGTGGGAARRIAAGMLVAAGQNLPDGDAPFHHHEHACRRIGARSSC